MDFITLEINFEGIFLSIMTLKLFEYLMCTYFNFLVPRMNLLRKNMTSDITF